MNTKDKESREKMFNENIGLVYAVANRHYKTLMPEHGDDLLQEGFAALLNAIDGFDKSKGFKFSTYATYIIWGKMGQFVNTKILQKKKTSVKRDGRHMTGYLEANICSIHSRITDAAGDEALVMDVIGECDAEFEVLEDRILIENMFNEIKRLEQRSSRKSHKGMHTVMVLKYKGYTNDQIAKVLGVSHTAVQNRFDAVREYFRARGGNRIAM